MKKIISVLVLATWMALPAKPQTNPQGPNGGTYPAQTNGYNQVQRPGGGGRGQNGGSLEAMKIGFITKRLNLTPEEAERFWPIYNRYVGEIRQAHIDYRQHQNEIRLDEAILNIKKKYNFEFGKALSPDKVNEFFRAEKDFGAVVQKEFQRRQMQGQMRRGGAAANNPGGPYGNP